MTTKIVMYTKNDCPNCKRAKFMLQYCPIEVELIERNIEEFEGHKTELEFVLESTTLPTFYFENGTIVRGFEEGKIMNELGL
ncbi:NrdH-redoxin [Bacillus toyonensis]|uniref:glutaredoxin family protein n=1 Tax=Bacillus toyonensis TaxID=155322 RepID=UPI000BF25384|nr:glutaredoxin domain-containing protein [Bacillus toyonensis]PGB25370.1 NrdH-redoxin [Bacillus toyonensis]